MHSVDRRWQPLPLWTRLDGTRLQKYLPSMNFMLHAIPKGPCQNVHHSCDRWQRQGRCEWHKAVDAPTPFFIDNCALSCGFCQTTLKNIMESEEGPLVPPLPPMLETLVWLVGRWQTRTLGNHNDRFPAPLSGPYVEAF